MSLVMKVIDVPLAPKPNTAAMIASTRKSAEARNMTSIS